MAGFPWLLCAVCWLAAGTTTVTAYKNMFGYMGAQQQQHQLAFQQQQLAFQQQKYQPAMMGFAQGQGFAQRFYAQQRVGQAVPVKVTQIVDKVVPIEQNEYVKVPVPTPVRYAQHVQVPVQQIVEVPTPVKVHDVQTVFQPVPMIQKERVAVPTPVTQVMTHIRPVHVSQPQLAVQAVPVRREIIQPIPVTVQQHVNTVQHFAQRVPTPVRVTQIRDVVQHVPVIQRLARRVPVPMVNVQHTVRRVPVVQNHFAVQPVEVVRNRVEAVPIPVQQNIVHTQKVYRAVAVPHVIPRAHLVKDPPTYVPVQVQSPPQMVPVAAPAFAQVARPMPMYNTKGFGFGVMSNPLFASRPAFYGPAMVRIY